MFNPEMEMLQV